MGNQEMLEVVRKEKIHRANMVNEGLETKSSDFTRHAGKRERLSEKPLLGSRDVASWKTRQQQLPLFLYEERRSAFKRLG